VDHHQSSSHRSKSESPSTTAVSVSNVHRTSTAPQFNHTGTTSTTVLAAPWITPVSQTSDMTETSAAGSDVALMSTLLRALRNYSTTAASSSGCHGSPVMILKEMIDRHFTETAAVTSPSPVSPVNNRTNTAAIASHVRHVSLYIVSLLR